ncbi:PEP-CTERM sorting domain-containing protein [uncultured Akkermansia sp.]|uniref:PEP-CTERM sorting domain-containing protein n=2 Tax=uncultured Akkermansia sp. TaxID=512294 RepID=UPI0026282B2F|nr:PEP-CTERM sorting domain-containing protein [uncultured Akkermansia sp.]
MKLSTFCILCCLSAGLSQAATYMWSGAAENGIYGDPNNWTVNGAPNGYYPQSNNDNAVIGENAGTITWSTSQSYFGATSKVVIGSGSTLVCTTAVGDLNVDSFTLNGNSHLIFESSNALGLGRNFTLNFGSFSAEEHGTLTATDIPGFWTNGKTLSFIGVLHAADLSGSGTIELASIKSSQLGGDLYLDLAGLYIESTPQIQAAVTQVTENGVTKVLINYETVPEPATATLSLLGLGGLLLRRKRQ